MKNILIILLSFVLFSCYSLDRKDIVKIKIGMPVQDACILMSLDVDDWDEYNAPNEYRYGANYDIGAGYKNTFWIIVKNGKVVNFYSI